MFLNKGERTADKFNLSKVTMKDKKFNTYEPRVEKSFESMCQLLPDTLKDLTNLSKGIVSGISTGFIDIDQMTTGLQKGDLVIVAGRPSMGKTAFGLSVALNATVKARHCTAIFSLESSKNALVRRMLCSEARINMYSLISGTLPSSEFQKLSAAMIPLSEAPLFIDDTPGISVLELRAKARHLKKQQNLELIVIDNLLLLSSGSKTENSQQQEISQISRSLKAIAKELDITVIALSLLPCALKQRDRLPKLSDLREPYAIEQYADIVMFVHREEYYKKGNPGIEGQADIIIDKNRNGPVGDIKVAFEKDYARFDNIEDSDWGWDDQVWDCGKIKGTVRAVLSDNILTISGVGEMMDYDDCDNRCPRFNEYFISDIVIEDGVTSIGDYAFFNSSFFDASITIPKSVTSIGKYAFYSSGINSIYVAWNNEYYSSEDGVLFNKDKTTLVAYPGRWGKYTIPDGVTSIGDFAFAGCENLTSVTIPKSVISIGEGAFDGCSELTSYQQITKIPR